MDTFAANLATVLQARGWTIKHLADLAGMTQGFIEKFTQLHDHKGTLILFWSEAPSDTEREYFRRAWASKIGDGSDNVEHET